MRRVDGAVIYEIPESVSLSLSHCQNNEVTCLPLKNNLSKMFSLTEARTVSLISRTMSY